MDEGNYSRHCPVCSARLQRRKFAFADMPIDVMLTAIKNDASFGEVQREVCPNGHGEGWFVPTKERPRADFPLDRAVKE
jgi:hypothetical protein